MQVGVITTEKKRRQGNAQLARHAFNQHVLPAFENMLGYTAMVAETTGVEMLFKATQPLCAGCGNPVHEDKGYFYVGRGRTQHCCSMACQFKAEAHG